MTKPDQPGPGPEGQTLTKVRMDPARHDMASVSFLALDRESPCLCDVFLPVVDQETKAVAMKLICPQGQVFRPEWWDHLDRAGLRSVCVRSQDVGLLLEEMEARGARLMEAPNVPLRAKAMFFREMAAMSVQAMFSATSRSRETTDKASRLARSTMELLLGQQEVTESLSSVLVSSRTIYDHSVNVCLMSMALGRHLGLDRGRLLDLGMGALMHDYGMIRVPPEIRDHPGELNAEQRALMQKHPTWGHQSLSLVGSFPYHALNIVLNHHERADGTGYPNRMAGNNIPAVVRLVKVVDAFDAMTSPRPHRAALAPGEAAAELLKMAGPDLDREMTVEFLRLHSQAFH